MAKNKAAIHPLQDEVNQVRIANAKRILPDVEFTFSEKDQVFWIDSVEFGWLDLEFVPRYLVTFVELNEAGKPYDKSEDFLWADGESALFLTLNELCDDYLRFRAEVFDLEAGVQLRWSAERKITIAPYIPKAPEARAASPVQQSTDFPGTPFGPGDTMTTAPCDPTLPLIGPPHGA